MSQPSGTPPGNATPESPGAPPPAAEQGAGRSRSGHDVFVSHTSAHEDKLVADAIVSRLEQAGIRCWSAPRDVEPGRVWGEAIIDAIAASKVMVVVLSGQANESRHVHREVERAVANNVVVIPFRTESVEPSGAMAYFLASEHWLDALQPPLEAHIARLADVIGGLLQQQGVPRRQAAPAGAALTPPGESPASPRATEMKWYIRYRWWLAGALVFVVAGVTAGLLVALLPSGTAAPTLVPTSALKAGDCLQAPGSYEQSSSGRKNFWTSSNIPMPNNMPRVPCQQPHSGEVFFAGDAWPPGGSYPGDQAVKNQAKKTCDNAFQDYVGISYDNSILGVVWLRPVQATWANGDRLLTCFAYDPSGTNSQQSVRNSHQ